MTELDIIRALKYMLSGKAAQGVPPDCEEYALTTQEEYQEVMAALMGMEKHELNKKGETPLPPILRPQFRRQ